MILARVVEQNMAAMPIFERVDAEYRAALAQQKAMMADDPIERIRALAMARKAEVL